MTLHANSWNSVLAGMEVGDRSYYDTTLDNYATLMSTANVPISRRPQHLKRCVFTTKLFTAVGSNPKDIRYLVCLERVK